MHPYDDIGDASSSLWGSTSSFHYKDSLLRWEVGEVLISKMDHYKNLREFISGEAGGHSRFVIGIVYLDSTSVSNLQNDLSFQPAETSIPRPH